MFTVQPLWLSRTELLLRTYNSHQINPKWGRNSHTWHKQKRWSSGWGCTDLRASCRMGTAPYRDLLVDKHTELCLRSLFLPPKKSLPLALWLSSAHSVSSWKCVLFNSMCFHWWLFSYLVPAFRSLLLAFIIFPLPFFFTYLLSRPPHPPPPTPLHFPSPLWLLQRLVLEENQSNQMLGESGRMGGAEEWGEDAGKKRIRWWNYTCSEDRSGYSHSFLRLRVDCG